jgi:hypothetical protein
MALTALIWVGNQERPVLLKKDEVQALMAEYLDVEPEKPEEPEDVEKIEEPMEDVPTDLNNQVAKEPTETKPTPKEATPEKQNQQAKASEKMSASDQQEAEAAVSNSFLFQQLGTTGEGKGMIASVFGDGSGAEGADLDAVLDGVSDGREAVTGSEMSVRGQIDKTGIGSAKINVEGANSKAGKSETGSAPAVKVPRSKPEIAKIDTAMGECADGINKTVRKYLSQVKACHEATLKSDPNVAGRVVIDIEILDGKVASAQVAQNKTGDSALGSCIQRRVKRWKFPKDCSDIASIPFVLSPKK